VFEYVIIYIFSGSISLILCSISNSYWFSLQLGLQFWTNVNMVYPWVSFLNWNSISIYSFTNKFFQIKLKPNFVISGKINCDYFLKLMWNWCVQFSYC
jgi:hypothetical protein